MGIYGGMTGNKGGWKGGGSWRAVDDRERGRGEFGSGVPTMIKACTGGATFVGDFACAGG